LAIRPVLHLPNPVLKQKAAPVEMFDDAARALATDLLDTMRDHTHSVGIAAPQIGVSLRAFAIDVSRNPKMKSALGELVLFNPSVVSASDPVVAREGCMSVPDFTGDVARASFVVVRAQILDGEERTLEAEGFEARALLHEIDHLDGFLFLDRVSSRQSVFRRKTYR
jgi:peptide deformylase